MSTNPNNSVGTNGAYDGRTSVNAFNDVLGVFNGRGILSGWALQPGSGMTITAGGDGSTRDVAIAEDNIGNKTTINNISEAPVPVTISAAPVSNSRIDLVVAYVDNPPQGTSTVTDNYGACGLITVEGTAASTPTAPTEADIRTAITADGGAGTVAYYVVLGSVTVASGTTDITSNMITAGGYSGITSHNIDFTTLVETRFSNNIYSRKYSDGLLICYGTVTLTTGTSPTADGRYYVFQNVNLPTAFNGTSYYVECESAIGTGSVANNPRATASASTAYQVQVGLQANTASYTREVRLFAIGAWK